MMAPVQNYILFMDFWYEFLNSVYAEVYFMMTIDDDDNQSARGESCSIDGSKLFCYVLSNCYAKVGKIQN